jgi:uncharacterized protein (UPF0303 family)
VESPEIAKDNARRTEIKRNAIEITSFLRWDHYTPEATRAALFEGLGQMLKCSQDRLHHTMPIADDLARIAIQEQELQFASFDEETAWRLGSRVRALAVSRQLKIVIDVRRFGQPLFYTALPGTTPDNPEWVRRKSNVTLRFHRSSYAIGLEMEEKKSNLFERYGLPVADYASHGGCFPLRVRHTGVVGAVTVSGLPQRADHELAVEALCLELGHDFDKLRLTSEIV